MKKVALILVVAVLATAAGAFAATVVGSKHDLSSALTTSQQVCVFCHTPHNAVVSASGPTNVFPLWNHTRSTTASYTPYGSITMNATPGAWGGQALTTSALCMSCHDGTVGLGSLINRPNILGGEETPSNAATMISGNANLGTDLSNDHPVTFTYDAALAVADGGLVNPPPAALLQGGQVTCASCHDVHDPTLVPFMRGTMVASALCRQCHIK